MKRFTYLIILAIFLLNGCIGSQKDTGTDVRTRSLSLILKGQVPNDFIPREITITAIGDSLTQGVGDDTGQGGYLYYVQNQLSHLKGIRKVNIHNLGVRGNQSTHLIQRLKHEETIQPIKNSDLIIMTIGANDIMKIVRENFTHLSLDDFEKEQPQYLERLKDIVQTIRDYNNGVPIILIGLYNPFISYFSDLEEINQIIHDWNEGSFQVVQSYENMYFTPIQDVFMENIDELLSEDYFHPNQLGYQLIGNRVTDTILEKNLDDWMYEQHVQKE